MKKILVIYHKDCPDGFGAAFSAWKKFGAKAEYVAVNPETLPKVFPKNREIYAVDISYPIKVQEKLREKNRKLVIIDHHISLKNDTEHFPENIFQNNHSGAVLAWRYFHKNKKIPKLLLHIEDLDLWNWKLPQTREIFSALNLLPFEFKTWDSFVKKIESSKGRSEVIKIGKIVDTYEKMIIKRMMNRAVPVVFEGVKTLAVNSAILESEIGNELVKKLPPIGIVWREKKDGVSVSLRSNGKIDVSKIASKYGGGGHARSSGFGLESVKKLPWKKRTK